MSAWAGQQNRYCVTKIDDAPAPGCCGGTCMAMTTAIEFLGTQPGVRDHHHAEEIVLSLDVGDHVDINSSYRLWRKF